MAPVALLLAGCTAVAGKGARTTTPSPRASASSRSASATPTSTPTPTASAAPAFDASANSTTDPASIWIVVNKKHSLSPVDYAPADLVYPGVPNVNHQPLRAAAANALVAMFAAGTRERGLSFSIQSGYRSYPTQVSVYDQSVAANGKAVADNLTARPGTSEHQTGLAVDISAVPEQATLQAAFANTPHGVWLAANAWRFGFLLRYPADKVQVTGYSFEPWHFRFIGASLAAELHRTGVKTLEEFFGISGGTSY